MQQCSATGTYYYCYVSSTPCRTLLLLTYIIHECATHLTGNRAPGTEDTGHQAQTPGTRHRHWAPNEPWKMQTLSVQLFLLKIESSTVYRAPNEPWKIQTLDMPRATGTYYYYYVSSTPCRTLLLLTYIIHECASDLTGNRALRCSPQNRC